MKDIRIVFALLFMLVWTAAVAQINELPRAIPEDEGIESRAIIQMMDSLKVIPHTDIHHLMVMRNGKVVAEAHPAPFKAEYGHTLYSASKSFVSLAVGIAIDENRLRLTDRVATFFPDKLPATISANLADMTVRNLLTMSSGITPDWDMRSKTAEWERTWLGKKVEKPGKKYQYDSMSTFMLSAIVQRVTGKRVVDLLNEKIFQPMGIKEYDWEESPDGVNTGGWGLRLQTESLAKFGQLILNKGKWNGKQLISERWIKEATEYQFPTAREVKGMKPTDSNQGYGYQIWRCEYPGAVRADGALGQFVVIVPSKELVVVINANSVGYGARILSTIWRELMPGVMDWKLQPSKYHALLAEKCKTAQLAKLGGKKTSAQAKNLIGKKITLAKNAHKFASLRVLDAKTHYLMEIEEDGGHVVKIPFGFGTWTYHTSNDFPPYSITPIDRFKGLKRDFVVAGNYGWANPRILMLNAYYVNWVSERKFAIELKKDGTVNVNIRENYSTTAGENIKGTIVK